MIKKILVGLAALVVVVALVGMLLPRNVRIQRTITIDRPAASIYGIVNSLRQFPNWSPWQHLDPAMTQTFEGPAEGVGAKMTWSGNDKVGSGTQVITGSVPGKLVTFDVDFAKEGISKAAIELTPSATGTRVTWTLDTDMGAGPIGRYFGLMMDRMIGKDYEAGLAKLKSVAEKP